MSWIQAHKSFWRFIRVLSNKQEIISPFRKAFLSHSGSFHYFVVVKFFEFDKIRQPVWRSIALLSDERVIIFWLSSLMSTNKPNV